MHHHPLSTTMTNTLNHPNSPNYPSAHHHSTTLDLLILTLVVFSAAFLLTSFVSHLCFIIYHFAPDPKPHIVPIATTTIVLSFIVVVFRLCRSLRSRNCGRRGCRAFKNSRYYDLQVHCESLLKLGDTSKCVRDVNELAWKGDTEDNPYYESLRAELRRMAPANGRAVLIFRDKCGCPVAKLEGWGPKNKKRSNRKIILTVG